MILRFFALLFQKNHHLLECFVVAVESFQRLRQMVAHFRFLGRIAVVREEILRLRGRLVVAFQGHERADEAELNLRQIKFR